MHSLTRLVLIIYLFLLFFSCELRLGFIDKTNRVAVELINLLIFHLKTF